jgi:hypothetical protein
MSLPAWLSKLEDIGKHINQGIEEVANIVVKFAPEIDMIPIYGPAIEEVAKVVSALESRTHSVNTDDFQKMVSTLSAAAHIKSALSVKPVVVIST